MKIQKKTKSRRNYSSNKEKKKMMKTTLQNQQKVIFYPFLYHYMEDIDKKILYNETKEKINDAFISPSKKLSLIYLLKEKYVQTDNFLDFRIENQSVLACLLKYELDDDRSEMN